MAIIVRRRPKFLFYPYKNFAGGFSEKEGDITDRTDIIFKIEDSIGGHF